MKNLVLVFPLTDEQKEELNELFEKLISKYSEMSRNSINDDILATYSEGICDGINICWKIINDEINNTDILDNIDLK